MIRSEDEIPESQDIPLRPAYKIPKGVQEAKDELMGHHKLKQDEEPKSAKIMKFM